jgi:hypothetical protein
LERTAEHRANWLRGWAVSVGILAEHELLSAESKQCPMNSQQLAFGLVINEARVLEPFHEKTDA